MLDEEQLNKSPVYASFTQRFFATIIDFILLFLLNWFISIILGIDFFDLAMGVIWYGNILILVYFTYMESSPKQATLGKQIMGIKVVSKEGGRITVGQSIIRSLSKIISAIILLIGFIIAAFSDKKQALHDIIASTYVVKEM